VKSEILVDSRLLRAFSSKFRYSPVIIFYMWTALAFLLGISVIRVSVSIDFKDIIIIIIIKKK
jgi:hypothetical protein